MGTPGSMEGPIQHSSRSTELEQVRILDYELLPDNQSLRLLILEPGERNEPLRGILRVISMKSSEFGSHDTLSYVWGTASRAHEILIHSEGSERAVKLTPNLYGALRRLRLSDQKRSIWVDQVCIDQKNLKERSHQVRLMNELYKHAGHVLVWLGPDAGAIAELALSFVFELDKMFQDEKRSKRFHTTYTKELDTHSRESWVCLDRLMELEWFTRGWIVQEIGTRAPATLIWGEAEIDWLVLCRVCQKLQNYYAFRSKFKIRTDEVRYLSRRFVKPDMEINDKNRFNFIYELHRARRLKFHDQRDRIFAWLGHFSLQGSNEELNSLQANYNQTVTETYTNVARKALFGEKGNTDGTALIILAAVQHVSLQFSREAPIQKVVDSDEGEELPSWVPDWRIFRCFMLTEPACPHRAHGTSGPKLQVYDNSRLLRIHGLEVDSIEACSRPLAAREFHSQTSTKHLEPTITYLWRKICRQNHFNLCNKYLNGETSFFAYMQTLGNGCVQIARRENLEYREIPKSRWLEHEAMYLIEAVGDSDSVSLDLRELADKARKEHEEEQWSRSANGASENRTFARTRKGYYILGPELLDVGDIVCVLFGGKLPFCLRPRGDQFILVGECYAHGLMEGEAMEMADRQELVEKVFEIL